MQIWLSVDLCNTRCFLNLKLLFLDFDKSLEHVLNA